MAYGSISVDKITTSDGFTLGGSGATMKNRIINGDMRIDQRNAGASVSADNSYPVDRFFVLNNLTSGTFTAQRSATAPTGFANSVVFTTGTAGTASSSQRARFTQPIEGNNIADLGWGTASAKTITLSFWVRSSLTGTFSGALRNNDADRSYVFNYAVSSANTFEYKTVTIAGDTSGTWDTGTGQGINVQFDLGSGSNFETTAGSWASGNYLRSSGSVSVAANAGATWYITGVQLEVGSQATSFDYRHYGTELALCQRYYFKSGTIQSAAFTTYGDQLVNSYVFYQATRATPSVSVYSSSTNTVDKLYEPATSSDVSATVQNISVTSCQIRTSGYSPTVGRNYSGYVIVSSEL